MRVFYVLLLFCLMAFNSLAQHPEVSVYFAPKSSVASDADLQKLKQWLLALKLPTADSLHLQALSDPLGDEDQNMELSRQRGLFVQQYLATLGYTHTSLSYLGENHRSSAKPEQDRVVHIWFYRTTWQQTANPLKKTAQIFQGDAGQAMELEGAEGTRIFVPANTFVTKDGRAPQGPIRVELTEYYKRSDMVLNGLTTTTSTDVLQSGGMVYLRVFEGDSELVVKKDGGYELQFANANEKDGMQLYSGYQNANNQLEWTHKKEDIRYRGTKGNVDSYDIKSEQEAKARVQHKWGHGKLQSTDTVTASSVMLEKMIESSVLVKRTGWHNWDRMYNFTQGFTTMYVKAPANFRAEVRFLPKNALVLLPGVMNKEGLIEIKNVPRGANGYLTGLSIKNNKQVYMAVKEIVATDQTQSLSFEELSVSEAKERARKLD